MALSWTTVRRRLKTYVSFVKLEHTIFSLPLIYAGAWIGADGAPTARLCLLILLAAVGARTSAMGLNRLIDLEIDRRNPRTQRRELPQGLLRVSEGWAVVTVGVLIYLGSAAAIAPICLQLAPIPLALFVLYPYLKRVTDLTHLGLGLAWSMAPLGGWLATAQSLHGIAKILPLWAFAWVWVSGFDIIYATLDVEFDRQAKLHSLPVAVGTRTALLIAALFHVGAWVILSSLYRGFASGPAALFWLLVVGALLVWEHVVAPKNPEFAFFQINALIGFCVFGLVYTGI